MMLNATLSIFQWYRGGHLYCWSYRYGYFKHIVLSSNNTDNGSDTYEGFFVTNKSLKRQYIKKHNIISFIYIW